MENQRTSQAPSLSAASVSAKLLDAAKAGRGASVAIAPEIRAEAGELRSIKFLSEAHRIDALKVNKGDRVSEIPFLKSNN